MPAAPAIELSVLVPCFNEEGNLPELVERTERVFERRGIAGEVVLVDDGSRDGTAAQIEALAARFANVVAVHHPTNRGIPAGWRSGFEASRGRYVCTIDADLQYQPEAIAQLYREISFSKADLVQGWRSTLERYPYDFRYYMSRGLDHLLKIAFGMHEHDVKSGFVIYKREVFEDILQDASRYFYFQHMITVIAKARGYSLRQIETVFEERHVGHSFISRIPIKMIARTLVDVARGVTEIRLREPRDRSLARTLAMHRETSASGAIARRGLDRSYPADLPTRRLAVSRNAPHYLAELRRTQWLPGDAIEELQLRRLRRLVQHAYAHVGYWGETLQAASVVPDDVRTLADLPRIPMLTKEAVRENIYFDLLSASSDKRKIEKLATTGSTGELLGLFVDRLELDMRWATTLRGLEWTGFRLGDPRVRLSHSPRVRGTFLESIRWGCRSVFALQLDDGATHRLAEQLRRRPPALLQGGTEILAVLAQALPESEPLSVGRILTGGETLTPELRGLIERRLGGPVFDAYGAREVGVIAQECEAHRGHHVNAESFVVEVVRNGRPVAEGEPGEILVTDLNNHCVPLLRYRLGDTAILRREACACGRSLPRLERIAGETAAAARGADGRIVPATSFAHLFEDYEYAVVRYQIAQDGPGEVRVRILRKSRFTAETEQRLRAALARLVGPGTAIRLEFVDRLPGDAGLAPWPRVGPLAPPPFPDGSPVAWPEVRQREAAN